MRRNVNMLDMYIGASESFLKYSQAAFERMQGRSRWGMLPNERKCWQNIADTIKDMETLLDKAQREVFDCLFVKCMKPEKAAKELGLPLADLIWVKQQVIIIFAYLFYDITDDDLNFIAKRLEKDRRRQKRVDRKAKKLAGA